MVCNEQDDSLEKEALLSYYHQSKIPPLKDWPRGSSIYVCASRRAPEIKYDLQQLEDKNFSPPFPLDGTPVRFESPIFQGKIASRVKNAYPRSNLSTSYFKGKTRMFQWTAQGKFKKRLRFDELITGQEFDKPFRNMPSTRLVRKCMNMLRNRLPDSFEWSVHMNIITNKLLHL